MYMIICLDDNNGLAFNHRRQSQDRIVAEDIRKTVGEKKLWITDYSRKLFHSVSNLEISENPKEKAKEGEYNPHINSSHVNGIRIVAQASAVNVHQEGLLPGRL